MGQRKHFLTSRRIIGEINSLVNENLNLGIKSVPTSRFTLEIINKNTDKGNALKKARTNAFGRYEEHCGNRRIITTTLICLKRLLFLLVCAKAPPKVKAVSKYCACDANKGAVADFICYLTENYIANDL